eukprot:CAMPEP_0181033602 /NCGR_PEP_ID=MMETSP1070-20121207/7340_1 /TAXON_ID=265543 /ORGANISM="Minutocellus polymorphus, Strain NH13" /LENGTH=517 /DNA_ID=CAMNT_0023111031 /DNA_START=239 /DNA_END=1789 /DNA_ORIENTATION=+
MAAIVALLDTPTIEINLQDGSPIIESPVVESKGAERRSRETCARHFQVFVQNHSKEVLKIIEGNYDRESFRKDQFWQLHHPVVQAAKRELVSNLFVAMRVADPPTNGEGSEYNADWDPSTTATASATASAESSSTSAATYDKAAATTVTTGAASVDATSGAARVVGAATSSAATSGDTNSGDTNSGDAASTSVDANSGTTATTASTSGATATSAADGLATSTPSGATADPQKKKKTRKRKRGEELDGPHRVALYAIIGYSEQPDKALDTSGTAYKYSHRKNKPAVVGTTLPKSGKATIPNPIYSPEGAKYLQFWARHVAFVSSGLLAMHRKVTGCDVHGNNQLSEAAMKAAKMEDDVDRHLDGIAEYADYWNAESHASTVYAANQIGEMPARIARRDRISAARSRIEELTEEGEEEESMWSRDGTMEREGRRLRVQLKALEEKDGVVVASEVYKKLCQWLVKAKGKSIDEIKDDKEIMSSGTFTAWFNRGQKLGKSRKWRENLSGYIEKGCTEPVGK